MAKISVAYNSTEAATGKKIQKTLTDISSVASAQKITDFTKALTNLSDDTYVATKRVETTDLDHEEISYVEVPVVLPTPELSIGAWTKNDSIYTAAITYDGDGVLSTDTGTISGASLIVADADGLFSGYVTATAGTSFGEASCFFKYDTETVTLPTPHLSVGAWSKDDTVYTAAITYDGDGVLSTDTGTISGASLIVADADGLFSGYVTATAGTSFGEASCFFKYDTETIQLPAAAQPQLLLNPPVVDAVPGYAEYVTITAVADESVQPLFYELEDAPSWMTLQDNIITVNLPESASGSTATRVVGLGSDSAIVADATLYATRTEPYVVDFSLEGSDNITIGNTTNLNLTLTQSKGNVSAASMSYGNCVFPTHTINTSSSTNKKIVLSPINQQFSPTIVGCEGTIDVTVTANKKCSSVKTKKIKTERKALSNYASHSVSVTCSPNTSTTIDTINIIPSGTASLKTTYLHTIPTHCTLNGDFPIGELTITGFYASIPPMTTRKGNVCRLKMLFDQKKQDDRSGQGHSATGTITFDSDVTVAETVTLTSVDLYSPDAHKLNNVVIDLPTVPTSAPDGEDGVLIYDYADTVLKIIPVD